MLLYKLLAECLLLRESPFEPSKYVPIEDAMFKPPKGGDAWVDFQAFGCLTIDVHSQCAIQEPAEYRCGCERPLMLENQ